MSLYVLDTDHVTLHQRRHPVLYRRLERVQPQDLAVTIVTAEEQLRGWLKLIRRARLRRHQVNAYQGLRIALEYFGGLTVLDFDHVAASHFERLRGQKIRIGTRDLRIGATALAVDAVLLTRNHQDFAQIPGLEIEDWTLSV